MKTIRNKTRRPLRVPLPRGKTLHLGPDKTGEIAAGTVDHPPFKKLVEAGQIEIVGEGEHGPPQAAKDKAGAQPNTQGHGHSTTAFHTGER